LLDFIINWGKRQGMKEKRGRKEGEKRVGLPWRWAGGDYPLL